MIRKRGIDSGLSAAYPLSREAIEDLALDTADRELIASIVAEPQESPVALRGPRQPRLTARRLGGLAVTASAAAAIFLVFFGVGGGAPGSPAPAYGARLLRLAEISPHILLDLPNWRPVVVESGQALEGWTEFERGEVARRDPPPQQVAKFRWHAVSLQKREGEVVSNRAAEAGIAPVLGTSAQVYTYPGRPRGFLLATALWDQGGRAFEFRAAVRDIGEFEQRLAALQRVDKATWLAALPRPEGPFEIRCYDAKGVQVAHEVTKAEPSYELLKELAPMGGTCSIRSS